MTSRSAHSKQPGSQLSLLRPGFFLPRQLLAQTPLPPPAYGQADARQDRIEELENQLREATAENERLQFEVIQRDREINRSARHGRRTRRREPNAVDAAGGGGCARTARPQRWRRAGLAQ
jgi:TolA-binding protein